MIGELVHGAVPERRGPVADLLEAEAVRPGAPFLRWAGGEWTVADFADRARWCATALKGYGIEPGDRVAIMSRNSQWFLAWQYGIYLVGGVEVCINAELKGPFLAHIVQDSEPNLVLAQAEFLPTLEACGGPAVPLIDLEDEAGKYAVSRPGEAFTPCDLRPHDLATIMYTSGTTGPSKGVMIPHGYYSNLGHIFSRIIELTEADTAYWVSPFFHVDAHLAVPATLQSGAVFAFTPRFSVRRFWPEVEALGGTWTLLIGAMQAVLATAGRPSNLERLRMRRIFGAPIPQEMYEFYEDDLGIEMLEMFGMTESNGVLYGTPAHHRRGSAGWPCGGFEVKIVDEDGFEVPRGTPGEIVHRPQFPNMMTVGYWRRPEATVEAFRGLWYHTGDAGIMDEDGFVFFGGRLTDNLRRRGENVSAWELESALRLAPGVQECAAIGVRDEFGGEDEIKVLLELHEGADFDPEVFFAYCEANVPRFALPRFVQVVPAQTFVRGVGTGAIQKHRLPKDTSGPGIFDRNVVMTAVAGSAKR
jgi:crotonobetaine/carnitine-CoA ligase